MTGGPSAVADPARRAWSQLRRVVQYGQMTQSYKLALGRTLLDVAADGTDRVTLEVLARTYGGHLCRHIRSAPIQGRMTSLVLDACVHFNEGRIGEEELVDTMVDRGFRYVLDAFAVVRGSEGAIDLFERSTVEGQPGLVLNDGLLALGEGPALLEAADEVEARWRLVEHSWEKQAHDLDNRVGFEPDSGVLVPVLAGDRKPIAHFRPSLNSYHRDRCFYCGDPISLRDPSLPSHIDHYFPFVEMGRTLNTDVDEVWNLVLACPNCNLGKRHRLPQSRFLGRLHARNEALVAADHPLKETIVAATGRTTSHRRAFLQGIDSAIAEGHGKAWRWGPR